MSRFTLHASGSLAAPDRIEVRRAFSVLCEPSQWMEVRALPSGRSALHRGDDEDGFVRSVEAVADSSGIYYTLNPVRGNIGRAAKVDDIVSRRWLLVDIDPVKTEAVKDASATQAEKEAAEALSEKLRDYLAEVHDWPLPVIIDSGNGRHLLYRIDLPNNQQSQAVLRALLQALAKRFNDGAATVDTSVHNASRISKLPGTWARKGIASKDRPHRMAKLLFVPKVVEVLSLEKIITATDDFREPASQPETNGHSGRWKQYAANSHTEAYAQRALELEVARVRAAPNGNRNNVLNDAAFRIGTLIGAMQVA